MKSRKLIQANAFVKINNIKTSLWRHHCHYQKIRIPFRNEKSHAWCLMQIQWVGLAWLGLASIPVKRLFFHTMKINCNLHTCIVVLFELAPKYLVVCKKILPVIWFPFVTQEKKWLYISREMEMLNLRIWVSIKFMRALFIF